MAAAFSSSIATARMTVEGAPAWDLATLMPDGAVGASAAGGRAEALAQAFADEHRGWIALDDGRAEELLADPALARFAHWLRVLRRSRPHRLSEPEERILAEKTVIGAGAWRRLLDPQSVTVAETASVFGETLTFAHLLGLAEDPAIRFQLLARRLDEAVATVFRQIAIHRFEDAVHRERRDCGELSVARLGEHWMAVNRELYGDSLELTDGYAAWWSYVTHVFNSPGYVYACAYGQLLALAISSRYLEQGEAFVDGYLELLAAGGSRSPQRLGEIVGVDLGDPGFWATGLELIDRNLDEARDVAAAAMPA